MNQINLRNQSKWVQTPVELLCSLSYKYTWGLSKVVSSTIFWVFGMTRPGIMPQSPRPLATLYPLDQWASDEYTKKLLAVDKYIWNHLTVYKEMSSNYMLKNKVTKNLFVHKYSSLPSELSFRVGNYRHPHTCKCKAHELNSPVTDFVCVKMYR